MVLKGFRKRAHAILYLYRTIIHHTVLDQVGDHGIYSGGSGFPCSEGSLSPIWLFP